MERTGTRAFAAAVMAAALMAVHPLALTLAQEPPFSVAEGSDQQWPVKADAYGPPDDAIVPCEPGCDPCAGTTGHPVWLDASWENGLQLYSSDEAFHLHIGGNGQWDSTWLMAPESLFAVPGGATNGVENSPASFLRRVRLRFEGELWDQFDYIVEYDLANAANDNAGLQQPSQDNIATSPAPINVWMQIRDVPLFGDVRFGHQLKPIGMTNNTYQGFLPFMERSYNMDAFYGPFDKGFAVGVAGSYGSEDGPATFRYGVFRPLENTVGVAISHWMVGARATALLVDEDEGRRLVHVGLGSTYGDLVQDELRARARLVLRNGPGYAVPNMVDTGQIPGQNRCIVAPEFAMVLGSWTVQAEWAGEFLSGATPSGGPDLGTVLYHGGYVEALYFLTGEHQEYSRKEGVFTRVVPTNMYRSRCGTGYEGCGAWQVGMRFGYLDLNTKSIQGGQIYDWTLGLNWFLNANMKLQLNYMAAHREAPQDVVSGWINGVGFRAAYDF